MLYDKNRGSEYLSEELFRSPTSEYRGTPFWAWNCKLEKDELLRQIDIFKEMGLGGFHMHVRTGMETEYLSEEFMALIKSCVGHAKDNEMLAWLYDEDRWPSGAAGGFVTKDIKHRQKWIRFTANKDYVPSATAVLLGVFDVVLCDDGTLKSYKKANIGDEAEGVLWQVWREINIAPDPWFNGQNYVDTLDKEAIQKFIEVTHDKYFEEIGSEFSKTVPAIFTDEPQFWRKQTLPFAASLNDVRLPWTDSIPEIYKNTYGEDVTETLPELLWDLKDNAPSVARYRYHDCIAECFASAFADQCGKWCDEHGIALTGHMMEEPTLMSQTHSLGDAMRSYRSFTLPGIDMLLRDNLEFTTAKQAQSAVHQYGREGMMSELYGVTGWDFDFRGHFHEGNWQAALGVTIRVPHLSWVSMKGNAKRDYPASISYQSPWYKEYSHVEDHFARLNTALTRGKPICNIGVIHPVESYWLHWGPNEQTALIREVMDNNFLSMADWMLKGCIDFDYVCESLLPSLCEKGGAPLKVGHMEYDVIIVPACETLRKTTVDRLEAFRAAGGKLIFMDEAPKYMDAVPSERPKALYDISDKIPFNRSSLLSILAPYRNVEIRHTNGALTKDLVHQMRRDNHGSWIFICSGEPINEKYTTKDICDGSHFASSSNKSSLIIRIKGEGEPKLYDTVSGDIKPLEFEIKNGDTYIYLTAYHYDSFLIYLDDNITQRSLKLPAKKKLVTLKPLPAAVPYSLSEPNVYLLDMARYALDREELSKEEEEILRAHNAILAKLGLPERTGEVVQPWVIPDTPPTHTATLEYTVVSDIRVEAPILALEDADVAEIYFNGKIIEKKDLGYYTDKSIRKIALPPLEVGENKIMITLPFGQRSNLEACYLLGSFGVSVRGRVRKIVPLPSLMAFDSITYQDLPYYGGEITYHIDVDMEKDGKLIVKTPHYRAGVLTVDVDGKRAGTISIMPYTADLGEYTAGKHRVDITAYISRHNCFGHIHNSNPDFRWIGPDCWSTVGDTWTYEYRFLPEGLISTPIFYTEGE